MLSTVSELALTLIILHYDSTYTWSFLCSSQRSSAAQQSTAEDRLALAPECLAWYRLSYPSLST